MSGVMIALGFYGLARFLPLLGPASVAAGIVLIAPGSGGARRRSCMALVQRDVKRVLAYSTVENAGLVTLAIGVALLARRSDVRPWRPWRGPRRSFTSGTTRSPSRSCSSASAPSPRWCTAAISNAGAVSSARARSAPRSSSVRPRIVGLPGTDGFASEWLLLRACSAAAWSSPAPRGVADGRAPPRLPSRSGRPWPPSSASSASVSWATPAVAKPPVPLPRTPGSRSRSWRCPRRAWRSRPRGFRSSRCSGRRSSARSGRRPRGGSSAGDAAGMAPRRAPRRRARGRRRPRVDAARPPRAPRGDLGLRLRPADRADAVHRVIAGRADRARPRAGAAHARCGGRPPAACGRGRPVEIAHARPRGDRALPAGVLRRPDALGLCCAASRRARSPPTCATSCWHCSWCSRCCSCRSGLAVTDELLSLAFLLVLAPALPALAAKTVAVLTGRRGAPLLQPYRDLGRSWWEGVRSTAPRPPGSFALAPRLVLARRGRRVPAAARWTRPALVEFAGDLMRVRGAARARPLVRSCWLGSTPARASRGWVRAASSRSRASPNPACSWAWSRWRS